MSIVIWSPAEAALMSPVEVAVTVQVTSAVAAPANAIIVMASSVELAALRKLKVAA